MNYTFPFGQQLESVKQATRSPNKLFILGSYARAVYARWRGHDGKIRMYTVPVASEPYVFWRGEDLQDIIGKISIPKGLGSLEPASFEYNGLSGNILDEKILEPLGVTREEAWLCYLIQYPCMNPSQEKAVDRCYRPEVSRYGLPKCTVPSIAQAKHTFQQNRCTEIMQEIIESQCDTIILLGNLPIKYWLAYYTKFRKLADFGDTDERYGRMHDIRIDGKYFNILPLVSPRQAGKFGRANNHWHLLHAQWMAKKR